MAFVSAVVVSVGLKLVWCDMTSAQYNTPQKKGPTVQQEHPRRKSMSYKNSVIALASLCSHLVVFSPRCGSL